jgi:hypothetical protein
MEFKHLNQPDFDRERDGRFKELLIKLMREHPQTYCPEGTLYRYNLKVARLSYNEGYKQALRDWSIWKDGGQHIGCMQHDIKEIIADVDNIDKEK